MEHEHENGQDQVEGLVGAEQMIYEVLMAKTNFNRPEEAVLMAKSIFHDIDSLQGRNTHAENYKNPNAELSANLINPDDLALAAGIGRDLSRAILVRLNILKE